jgi:RNA polymerase subunit RPABC4/transcription elongation factor Spt4
MIEFLISWPGGSLESALRLLGLLILSYALVLWLSAIVWVYRDVRHRTNDPASQIIAVTLVAIFNLPGLIVYLVIRPQGQVSDAYERSLQSEAFMNELHLAASSCQNCRWPVEDDFNVCPHCRAVLREPCRSCARLVRTSWLACPYCATDRIPPRPVAPPLSRSKATAPLEPPRRSRAPMPPSEEEDEEMAPPPSTTARPPVAR